MELELFFGLGLHVYYRVLLLRVSAYVYVHMDGWVHGKLKYLSE